MGTDLRGKRELATWLMVVTSKNKSGLGQPIDGSQGALLLGEFTRLELCGHCQVTASMTQGISHHVTLALQGTRAGTTPAG